MAAREQTQYNTVTMDDGRIVDFPGNRRMLKTSTAKPGELPTVRLDFVNGETRILTLRNDMLELYAAHGAEQKLGDETAGLKDVEDMVIAIDALMERLDKGDWSVQKDASAFIGASILARALIEHSGKSPEVVKTFLASKTHAQKVELRRAPAIAPIIQKLEAEKEEKAKAKGKVKPTVDTDAMLGELA